MKILSLIWSYSDPAARFRILQYKDAIAKFAASLTIKKFYPPKESEPPKIFNYLSQKLNNRIWQWRQQKSINRLLAEQNDVDMVWQNRLLLYEQSRIEESISKPRVFDFDDSIWMTEGKRPVEKAIQSATMVFAGNEFLANFATNESSVKLKPSRVFFLSKFLSGNWSGM